MSLLVKGEITANLFPLRCSEYLVSFEQDGQLLLFVGTTSLEHINHLALERRYFSDLAYGLDKL